MKNWLVFVIVVFFVSVGNAQLLRRQSGSLMLRSRAESDEKTFKQLYPSGTNEFGRTWQEQREFRLAERERKAAEEAKKREEEQARIRQQEEEIKKAEEAHEAKYANLRIDGLCGFKFGELEKGFSYSYIAERDARGVFVELEKPIRHFKTAELSYNRNARRLNCISLVADARGVSESDIEREISIVKSIVEKKFGVELVKDEKNTVVKDSYLFETSKYRIHLLRGSWYIDTLRLSITDKKVNDTITTQWNLPAEKDAERF